MKKLNSSFPIFYKLVNYFGNEIQKYREIEKKKKRFKF